MEIIIVSFLGHCFNEAKICLWHIEIFRVFGTKMREFKMEIKL